jgi:hypothetical protein
MPSPLDEVVQLFMAPSADDPHEFSAGVKAITLRIPTERMYWIEALAEDAELSRNAMIGHLVKVGLNAVLGALPDGIRQGVEENVAARAEGSV